MNIPTKLGFREEDWNVRGPTMNIPTKLGFREEDWNVRGPTNEHSYQAWLQRRRLEC
jgi:hypothetical protein